MLYNIYM